MAAVSSMLNLPQQNDSSHGTYSTILSKLEACLLSVMSTALLLLALLLLECPYFLTLPFNNVSTLFQQWEENKDYWHLPFFQVNISYVKDFEESGMLFVGRDVDGERMEIMEIKGMIDALVL